MSHLSSAAPAVHRVPNRQTEANRRNSTLSTGPTTPEGKRRASLNALRHGLTGQTVVLPSDDLAAYQSSCDEFHAELKPKGLIETKLVQTIADTHWRLDRIRALENNLFALAIKEQEPLSFDPVISSALSQAKSLDQRSDLLTRLSLYEQRLNRTLLQAHAELKALQRERAAAESRALEAAAQIRNLKEALARHRAGAAVAASGNPSNPAAPGSLVPRTSDEPPWRPEESGFEFSSAQLTAWMSRRQLTKDAEDFYYHDRLPVEDTTPSEDDSID
jgi:hypothetical protein